nr:MAG TPA: adenine-specific methyltransferase [Caudoviricetes sp.]
MKSKTYEEFVEKFKPKKTTDDCYTPPAVYEAVKDWVVKEYSLEGKEIARPFYQGGDYERYDYPADCVVIDNPPFSTLTKICKWYIEKNIKFFLFAPRLTLFSNNLDVAYIIDGAPSIVYENGAKVSTSFITNLDTCRIRSASGLKQAIAKAQSGGGKELPHYEYPKNVVTSSGLEAFAKRDIEFRFEKDEVHFIRGLDTQKAFKKAIFGAGFLISDKKAKELREAKQTKTKEIFENAESKIYWELSDREKEIIKNLG